MVKYYSATTRNKIESFVEKWKDLEGVTQSEVRQRKQIWYINIYMRNLEKWYRRSYWQSRNRDTNVESKHGYQRGKEGGSNWETGIDTYSTDN